MRKLLVFIAFVCLTLSCSVWQVSSETIPGIFYKREKDKHFSKSYNLELKKDGIFMFVIRQKDASPRCKGKWRLEGNMIFTECEAAQVYEMISRAYLSERKQTFRIINNNKLEYQGIILMRKSK